MDAKETHKEKATWELCKNVAFCLEQIREKAPHKTAAIWPPTFHLINHKIKTYKHVRHYWSSRDELSSDVLLWTLAHERANVS